MIPADLQLGSEAAAAGRRRVVEPRPLAPVIVIGLVRVTDLVAVVVAASLAYLLYPGWMDLGSEHLAAVGSAVFVASVTFSLCKAYETEYLLSHSGNVVRVFAGWLIAFAFLLTIAFSLKISASYSRLWVFSWFALTPLLLAGTRWFFSRRIRVWMRTFRLADRTVILGAAEHGQRVALRIEEQGDIRTRVIGFIDDRLNRVPSAVVGHAVLGNVDHLITLIRQGRVDQVIVALPWSADDRIIALIGRLAVTPVKVRLAPDLVGLELANRSFTRVAGLPMLHVFDQPIAGWSRIAKGVEDRLGAGALLLLVAPLMGLIALAIKLDSRGPVLFKQKRFGFNDELIEVYKFRTMHTHLGDAGGAVQARKGDARVTRVGRLLRALSLDELPQLFNVLRGEMSLVGPRPHAVATTAAGRLFEDVVSNYPARHRVKPGITGWAQVNGWRGETDTVEKLRKRVEHDVYYINNWSIMFDLSILLRTMYIVLARKNAY